MQCTSRQHLGLTCMLVVILAGSALAQQHHQHHPGSAQESPAQPAGASAGTPAQSPIMERMRGMLERMQGMMERMQGMLGQRAQEGEHEDEPETDRTPQQHGTIGRHGMMGHGMPGQAGMLRRHLEWLTHQLELSEAQRAQALSLVHTHAKHLIRLRAELDTLTIDLQQLLEADTLDLAQAKQLLQAMASKEADLRLEHLTAMEHLRQLLTPEQQTKFRALRRQMLAESGMMGQARMMGRGGMRRGEPRAR